MLAEVALSPVISVLISTSVVARLVIDNLSSVS